MLFNNTTNGDPRSFFYYKGDFYIDGTEITLKDEYINSHMWNGKKLWKYARYDHQATYNGRIAYFFCRSKSDWLSLNAMGLDARAKNDYAAWFLVDAADLENAIEEITHPIKLEREETEAVLDAIATPKSDFDNPSLIILWLIYIIVMVGSLIFKQFYILWAIATIIFIKYRNDIKKH